MKRLPAADSASHGPDSAVQAPPPIEPISVRIPEAVRLTGLSRSRLYELIGTGKIEVAKVGASTLVLYASLRGFVESARRCRQARSDRE